MAGIQMNRTAAGVLLPPEVSSEIWSKTIEESVVQRLAPKITLPANGVQIQSITSDATAGFVSETEEIPLSRTSFGNKTMRSYKLGVIMPFSLEFRRDLGTLYSEVISRFPKALGTAFDRAVLHGEGAPVGDFDTLKNVGTIEVDGSGSNFYAAHLAALNAIATTNDGQGVTGWAYSSQLEGIGLSAVDGFNRPIFINSLNTDSSIGQILGRPVQRGQAIYHAASGNGGTPETLGFAADWSTTAWGQVAAVQIAQSDQATLKDNDGSIINLWQREMFAVRVTVEVGFRLRNPANILRFVSA